jgi:hypothetical protein
MAGPTRMTHPNNFAHQLRALCMKLRDCERLFWVAELIFYLLATSL